MSGKRPTAAAKAKAKAAAAAAAAAAPAEDGDGDLAVKSSVVNADYHKMMADAMAVIEQAVPGISQMAPVGMEGGKRGPHNLHGHQTVLTKESYTQGMTSSQNAQGGFNLFTLSLLESYTPGIPVNVKAVQDLASSRFAAPVKFPDIIRIAVDDTTYDPWAHLGALVALTPFEVWHGFILAMSRDISVGKGTGILRQWLASALSVCVFISR